MYRKIMPGKYRATRDFLRVVTLGPLSCENVRASYSVEAGEVFVIPVRINNHMDAWDDLSELSDAVGVRVDTTTPYEEVK